MSKEIDTKTFHQKMNADRLGQPVTEDEAAGALRNLGEFVALLYKINQREGIVPMEELCGTAAPPDPHNP